LTSTEEEGRRPIMFDTLGAARRLKEAGFPDPQAEALADAILETAIHNLATKAYIDAALERIARLLTTRMIAVAIVAVAVLWIVIRT
jgi:hypothetical protein